jgi:hypothetical protein
MDRPYGSGRSSTPEPTHHAIYRTLRIPPEITKAKAEERAKVEERARAKADAELLNFWAAHWMTPPPGQAN